MKINNYHVVSVANHSRIPAVLSQSETHSWFEKQRLRKPAKPELKVACGSKPFAHVVCSSLGSSCLKSKVERCRISYDYAMSTTKSRLEILLEGFFPVV